MPPSFTRRQAIGKGLERIEGAATKLVPSSRLCLKIAANVIEYALRQIAGPGCLTIFRPRNAERVIILLPPRRVSLIAIIQRAIHTPSVGGVPRFYSIRLLGVAHGHQFQ